eukprot:TRINITY_DN2009_c0_g1_i4.p1 TRINITY_DN2009_c0_g1~~TRINITY_DN2009_c0_g1_i4.p1  ORF type:complete len:135 (+),score=4.28 TRINITY_DN2009_c0_g1_i4:21-425(+)
MLVRYYQIFARVLLQNPSFFLSFFNRRTEHPSNIPKQNLLLLFIQGLIHKIDSFGEFRSRKLVSLALISLLKLRELQTDHPQLLANIIIVVTGIIADEKDRPVILNTESEQTDLSRAAASARYWDILYLSLIHI